MLAERERGRKRLQEGQQSIVWHLRQIRNNYYFSTDSSCWSLIKLYTLILIIRMCIHHAHLHKRGKLEVPSISQHYFTELKLFTERSMKGCSTDLKMILWFHFLSTSYSLSLHETLLSCFRLFICLRSFYE